MKTEPSGTYGWCSLFLTPLIVIVILILAALASDAALLPPMPSAPPVKRPAPLLSPSHAAAVKNKPMVKKSGGFTPASYPAAPILCKLALGVNFFGCDTNRADCVLYDVTHLLAQQRAGMGVTLEYADTVTATEWAWVAIFSPSPTARIVETEWLQPVAQRPGCRIFRARETLPEPGLASARSATPTIRVKSPEVRTWARPK